MFKKYTAAHYQKSKARISFLLLALLLSSMAFKTFHHLDDHDDVERCENESSSHLHTDSAKEHCFICEFLFSPFQESFIANTGKSEFINRVLSFPEIHSAVVQFSFNYSLRGPPTAIFLSPLPS